MKKRFAFVCVMACAMVVFGFPAIPHQVNSNDVMHMALLETAPEVSVNNTSPVFNAMWAYAMGSSQSAGSFSAGTVPGQINYMPKQMTAFVISPVPSSVTIYEGSNLIVSNMQWNGGEMSYNFTSPSYGTFNLIFTIQGSDGVTRTISYIISVLSVTTFISYTQSQNNLLITVLQSVYYAVQINDIVMAIAVVLAWIVAWYGWLYESGKRRGFVSITGEVANDSS